MAYVERAGLQIDQSLAEFVENEATRGIDVPAARVWQGLADMAQTFGPRTAALLEKRDHLQRQIDAWHKAYGPVSSDVAGYQDVLREIGYLVDEPEPFSIATEGLDPEISQLCGPQLVVPISNARYALNAANARWGSLYDAFYGTDAIERTGAFAPGAEYNAERGREVFRRVADELDTAFPLKKGSHRDVLGYAVVEGPDGHVLEVTLGAGPTGLADPAQFRGVRHDGHRLAILLRHNGLHMELVIDPQDRVGATHPAHLADVIAESALSTIQDCEDSVVAVDAQDKVHIYRNWQGLMKGDLSSSFVKNGETVERRMASDREYLGSDGKPFSLKGRSLLLVRNVGHLMTTNAVLTQDGAPIGEGLLDALMTVMGALHERVHRSNSRAGSVYVVKPKMHGPEEVTLACDQFAAVEDILQLPRNTIKIGIMDEERRTSANLAACIFEARERVFFINTGFLDRTGDEIHTSMLAGPVLPKAEIKSEAWLKAYEDRNVLIGLECGFSGRAQIGKGMWAAPEEMAQMLEAKQGHPEAGANCAWVPSPTAATLHSLHYHHVNVFEAQRRRHNEPTPEIAKLFSMPVLKKDRLDVAQIARELDNNAQGILGYVVRWVNAGVGCSTVPDLDNVGLMEDRATLRISAQHIANWLTHGVVSEEQVRETFLRMAAIVDAQNASDPAYEAMAHDPKGSVAFQAALRLALEGAAQPSGYTEPILHEMRAAKKRAA